MKRWLESRKPLMIFLGVVYVILALFVVSAFVRSSMQYRRRLYVKKIVDSSGDSIIAEYINVSESSGDAEKARTAAIIKAADEMKIETKDLPADNRGPQQIITVFQEEVPKVGENLLSIFKYLFEFFGAMKNFSIGYLIFFLVVIVLKKTDKEYGGIEHGSADWATNGEEYEVLSKSEGFILAKDHFMPMIPTPPSGKNGNILVIRRVWFW